MDAEEFSSTAADAEALKRLQALGLTVDEEEAAATDVPLAAELSLGVKLPDEDGDAQRSAEMEVGAQPQSARNPTQIVRARNWLTTDLDETVRTDELSLERDLDEAIGSVQQWREVQARRLEDMRAAALAELPAASAPPPPSASAAVAAAPSDAAARPKPNVARGRARPLGARPYADHADENACGGGGSSGDAATSGAERPQAPPPSSAPKSSAAERVALAEQSFAENLVEAAAPPPLPAAELERLLKAEAEAAEMERVSTELMEYSSGLGHLLKKLQILER